MIKSYNIFLDDVRIPTQVTWANVPIDQHYSVVRNFNEFTNLIMLRGLPKFVCYDHDLSDCHYGHGLNNDEIPYGEYKERTGYDCAKWLVAYCFDRNIKHPPYVVHSKNPIGKKNIESYINSYNKHLAEDEALDNCAMCGQQTQEPKSKNVNFRKNYIEGTGQLCDSCVAEIDNPSR